MCHVAQELIRKSGVRSSESVIISDGQQSAPIIRTRPGIVEQYDAGDKSWGHFYPGLTCLGTSPLTCSADGGNFAAGLWHKHLKSLRKRIGTFLNANAAPGAGAWSFSGPHIHTGAWGNAHPALTCWVCIDTASQAIMGSDFCGPSLPAGSALLACGLD